MASFSASVLAVSLLAAIPVSPVVPPGPPGVEAPPPLRLLARVLRLDRLDPDQTALLSIAALGISGLSFLGILRRASRGSLSVRFLLLGALPLYIVVTALPPLFSHDAYAYAMYGRIASVHQSNPYVAPPAQFANDPMFAFVDTVWRDQPTPYGPAFTQLAALLASVFPSGTSLIWAFKALAGLGGVATLALCATAARRLATDDAALAVATLGWNPLFLLVTIGGAHNDVLVSLGVALAFRFLIRGSRRPTNPCWDGAILVILTVTMLLKVTALVALALFVFGRTLAQRDASSRRTFLLVAVVTIVAPCVILIKPFLTPDNASLSLWSVARRITPMAPAAILARLAGLTPSWIDGEAARGSLFLALLLSPGIYFLFVFARLVRDLGRCSLPVHDRLQGMAWALALACLPLASPVLFPWYLVPALALAWQLPPRSRRTVMAIALLATIPVAVVREEPFRDVYKPLLAISGSVVAGWLLVCYVILGLHALRHPLQADLRERAAQRAEAGSPP